MEPAEMSKPISPIAAMKASQLWQSILANPSASRLTLIFAPTPSIYAVYL
jgi:hypothetical protein